MNESPLLESVNLSPIMVSEFVPDVPLTQDLIPCFECPGTLRAVILPYQTELPGLGKVTVEEVPMLRCPDCGDTVIGYQASARIDSWLNELRRQQGLPMPRQRSRTRAEKELSRSSCRNSSPGGRD